MSRGVEEERAGAYCSSVLGDGGPRGFDSIDGHAEAGGQVFFVEIDFGLNQSSFDVHRDVESTDGERLVTVERRLVGVSRQAREAARWWERRREGNLGRIGDEPFVELAQDGAHGGEGRHGHVAAGDADDLCYAPSGGSEEVHAKGEGDGFLNDGGAQGGGPVAAAIDDHVDTAGAGVEHPGDARGSGCHGAHEDARERFGDDPASVRQRLDLAAGVDCFEDLGHEGQDARPHADEPRHHAEGRTVVEQEGPRRSSAAHAEGAAHDITGHSPVLDQG